MEALHTHRKIRHIELQGGQLAWSGSQAAVDAAQAAVSAISLLHRSMGHAFILLYSLQACCVYCRFGICVSIAVHLNRKLDAYFEHCG